jgi:hypothetical protein
MNFKGKSEFDREILQESHIGGNCDNINDE